jgi:hypothetical protein
VMNKAVVPAAPGYTLVVLHWVGGDLCAQYMPIVAWRIAETAEPVTIGTYDASHAAVGTMLPDGRVYDFDMHSDVEAFKSAVKGQSDEARRAVGCTIIKLKRRED